MFNPSNQPIGDFQVTYPIREKAKLQRAKINSVTRESEDFETQKITIAYSDLVKHARYTKTISTLTKEILKTKKLMEDNLKQIEKIIGRKILI